MGLHTSGKHKRPPGSGTWMCCWWSVLFSFILKSTCIIAQEQLPVNLNEKNGLPTNFIYDITVDKYGYLWMATPKGAVKYNGYETKVFDFSSGLPNQDIWAVFADDSGRVWCGTHSNRLAYIRNDKVTLVQNAGFDVMLYPRHIQQFKNGIAWTDHGKFYYERNDTLHLLNTGDLVGSYVDEQGDLYSINASHQMGKITGIDSFPVRVPVHNNINSFAPYHIKSIHTTSFGKNLVLYFPSGDTVWVFTPDSSFSKNYNRFFSKKPQLIRVYDKSNQLILRYDQGFVALNKQYAPVNVIRLNKSWLNGIDGNKIPVVIVNEFWDTCIATNTKGLFISSNEKNIFKPAGNELSDFRLIKRLRNNAAVWWNDATHKGVVYKNGVVTATFSIPQFQLQVVSEIDSTRLFFFTSGVGYWYYPATLRMVPVAQQEGYLYSVAFDEKKKYAYNLRDMWLRQSDITGLSENDSFLVNTRNINEARYKEVLYDAHYNMFIAYKYDKIALIKNNRCQYLTAPFLNKIGLHNIEYIITDNKGSIFIKDNEHVVCVNLDHGIYKKLLTNASFTDAQMALGNNLLVIAGDFGLSFYKKDKKFSFPRYSFRNVKNKYYNHLYHFQVNDKNVFFTSDEGCFTVPLPQDNEYAYKTQDDVPYKMLLRYKERMYLPGTGDTLRVSQDNLTAYIDIINPTGNGKPGYSYNMGGGWRAMEGGQLTLAGLAPATCTLLYIKAKDKSWVSDSNLFIVYIVPLWWQTVTGKIFIASGILIFISLLVVSVYLTTRAAIKKRNERNQLQMDIELKSIYAQINPHFIFNTLSGTQYFIRENQQQQARLHLNKFSRLLRSYIHSSRNKYITIKDELANLTNYIELQQIRFADKFDYKIDIAPGLPVENIQIPSLLLQPLVENAINHGLFHVEGYKGLLFIRFYKDQATDELICVIDDNGIGRKKAKEIKAESIVKTESYGDALIKDLIDIFNRYEKLNIHMMYVDKQLPDTGTTVMVKIKNPVYTSKI